VEQCDGAHDTVLKQHRVNHREMLPLAIFAVAIACLHTSAAIDVHLLSPFSGQHVHMNALFVHGYINGWQHRE
jgi:hypothetical protein